MSRALAPLAAALVLAGCAGDLVMPFELDHDRVVAVRSSPPRILAGERAEIDALLATPTASPVEAPPELATVIAPASLASTLTYEGGRWFVTAPAEPQLAAARAELMLAADAPVPLQVGVSYAGQTLLGTKTVWLGATAQNPSLASATIDGVALAAGTEIVATREVPVTLSIEATEEDDVNWLTSVGETRDFDLPLAYLEIPLADEEVRVAGDLALVVRAKDGGVAWRVWTLRVQ